ncbi:uncharacterized protein LOC144592155 isoform X2 [Rhinoraja longicauda]
MFRRSRLSIRPNVKPGGRSSSQALKGDDKTRTSDQQLNSEEKSSNEKDDSGLPAESFPPTPLPNPGVAQEERDDPDEQQENVPLNKNEKNDKTGVCGTQGKSPVAPLQRRKRFSTVLNLPKPRATSLSAQQSANLTAKSPQQQNLLTPVTNVASIQDNSAPSTTEKALPKSPENRKPSLGQHIKLPEKKTPIPQVPQFSPVKNHVHKDPAVGTSSPRVPVTRKTLSSPLKERITPSGTPTKGIVPSPSVSPARSKSAKAPTDLERLRKARKLRELLKEEMKKEKKAHKEMIPNWETNHPPERTKMTMRDFIYYLPDTNPMLSSFEEERRPPLPVLNKEPEVGSTNAPANEDEDEDEDEESDDAALGPRVKVAEDGSIIIDEESLTVEVLRMKKSNIVEENDPIFERGSQTTYSSFKKSTHTKPWSDKETDMFFLAISMVGTDFSMIGQLFPNRTRIEIKNKFKREEKLNSWRIDKAFKEKKPLDLGVFGELLTRVLEGEAKRKRERNGGDKSQAPRKSTNKRSRKSKILKETESDPDDPDSVEETDHELAEDDSNAIAEGTEADCSQEGAQNEEAISKAYSIKHKQKRKMKDAAEQSEEEIATEQAEKDDGIEKSKCKVHQRNKGDRKDSASVSIVEDEDENNNVTNGETLSDRETSESKQSLQVRIKEKPNEEDISLSGCEGETLSGTTTPVTRGNSNKSQLARRQKTKPNLKLVGRKKAGGKQDITTAPKPSPSYNNGVESEAVEEKKFQPVKEKESGPVTEKESEQDEEKESGPIKEKESGPVKKKESEQDEEKESGPVTEKESEQEEEKESGPVKEKESGPVEEREFEPIEEKDSRPIEEKGFEPIEEKESEVIEEEETGPFEEKGSVAVKEMESGPIEEMASGAIEGKESPPVEMESGPVEERESGPVVEKDSGPIEEKESGVIEEKESGPFEVKGSGAVEGKESQPIEGRLYGAVEEIGSGPVEGMKSGPVEGKESLAIEEKGPGPVEAIATGSIEGKEYGVVEEKVSGVIEEKETRPFEAMGSAAVEEKGSPLQDRNTGLEEPSEIMDVSSALLSETTEADKAEEISSSKVQDSDTEPRTVEKREEARNKPRRPVRSRFQKPKPNLGRAVVKKNVSTQEKKVATVRENNSAIQDIVGLSPDTAINKASEAHSASNAYFAMDARNLDDIPTQLDAVQNRSGGTSASAVSSSLSQSPSADAASSDLAAEPSRRSTWDSNKVLQSERTSEYDEQNEEEELTLAAIQENIMSRPTRSGRQPKPTTFYNPSAHHQTPSISTLLSEGENEAKVRSRPVRSHKAKPKVSKVLGKKEAQTKNTGKGQGTPKMTLVTLRASQEADDDEESDIEEEDDIYPINPEEVNKAPAFVPISLRSPESVQAQVEESMEELEIAINVSDKNYTSDAEHSPLELRDKSDPSQSFTFIPAEDYHPATAEQIEHFVEVIEVPSDDPVQEEDHCIAELGDSLRDAAYTDVICVDQKNSEEESVLGSDVPSLQIVVHSANDELSIDSSRPCAPPEKDLMGELDLQKPPLPEGDSAKAGSSSSVTGVSDGAERNIARRRCRFPKPKPNLGKSTSRSHVIKPRPTTENEEMKSSAEPTGSALEGDKQGNKTDLNSDDSLPIQLMTIEGSEENVTIKQIPAEQPNSRILVPDDQERCVSERLHILTSHEQDNCVREEQKMNRSEHLESGSENLDEQLNLFESDEQDNVGAKERLNRTEHTESGSEHLTEKLSLLLFDRKDKHVTDEEQMSKTEHLNNKVHDPGEELQASDEQDKCVGDEQKMNRSEHLESGSENLDEQLNLFESDEQDNVGAKERLNRTEHTESGSEHLTETLSLLLFDRKDKHVTDEEQMSKTEHLNNKVHDPGEELQASDEQDKCVGDEQKMNRSEHLESGSENLDEQLNLFESDEQDNVGAKERLNRTEHTESGSEHLTETLSLLLFDRKDKHVTDEEQMSKTEHLNNKVHDPGEELQASDEQDKCVGDEVEMNVTEHQNDDTRQLCERVSPADIQQYTTIQSQDVQPEMSSETYFTQSALTLCQAADPILSVETTETTPEAQCSSYSPKIDIKEPQNVEYQETLKISEENFENLLTDENSREDTIILTLFEIPASSLTEYGESSAPYIPVSENTWSYGEPCPPLTTENIKFTVSPDLSVEAPTVSSMPESVPILESNVQQWSSNMLSLNMGQMNRKRKADNLSDDQNDSVTKSPEITSSYEDPNENVPQTEEIIQSHLANFSSPEVCPAPSARNTLSSDDIAHMSVPPQSADDFTSTPLEDVLNPARVERSAQTPSEPEEGSKSSQIRRGKLAVKPNISTRRAASTSETGLSDINYNTLNISDTTRNAPSPLPPEESVQTEATCKASVDVDSIQQELGADDDSKCENEAQDAAETATVAELACYSPEILVAVTDEGTVTGQSDTSTQSTGSTSSTTLKRPVRKPRGFLSFISKKSSEGESEVKSKRTKFQKPCINLPQFTGKRPIPTAADAEEMKASGSPPAKRQSCDKVDASQPNTTSSPTKVMGNSSLQSWQSESYTEEACCAAEQDTEQMLPTRVAEYFFSDIFTEVEEQE